MTYWLTLLRLDVAGSAFRLAAVENSFFQEACLKREVDCRSPRARVLEKSMPVAVGTFSIETFKGHEGF